MNKKKMLIPESNSQTSTTNTLKKTGRKVDFNDFINEVKKEIPLTAIKLNDSETVIIPFMTEGEEADLHFCNESQIRGYQLCNGPDCVLCKIGRNIDQKLLVAVYSPATSQVEVLPVGKSYRPYALLPQLLNVLNSGKRTVMGIVRDQAKYYVTTNDAPADVDCGEAAMKQFMIRYESGEVDLTSVYQQLSNEELADIPEISRIMQFKGVSVNAGHKRP